MPAPVAIYRASMNGLSRFVAHRFGMDEPRAREIVNAIFYDFLFPMVMKHGERFRIPNIGTFRRFAAKSRFNPLSGRMSTPHVVLKFRATKDKGG